MDDGRQPVAVVPLVNVVLAACKIRPAGPVPLGVVGVAVRPVVGVGYLAALAGQVPDAACGVVVPGVPSQVDVAVCGPLEIADPREPVASSATSRGAKPSRHVAANT